MRVNFRQFPVYKSIKKDVTEEVDISYIVSNSIYMGVAGVAACSLALRIYEQGEVELSEKECEIIRMVADNFVGVLAESIKDKV